MNNNKPKPLAIGTRAGIGLIATLLPATSVFAEDVVAVSVPEPGIIALFTGAVAVAGLIYRNRRK